MGRLSRDTAANNIAKIQLQIEKARVVTDPKNSLGQWIGYAWDAGTRVVMSEAVDSHNLRTGSRLTLQPGLDGKVVRLPDDFGDEKQIDHTVMRGSKPLIIAESKWLKDKRHLNDKGSWIRLLAEVVEINRVEGTLLVLAGPWDSYRERMEKRGFDVVIASVDEIYAALATYGVKIRIDKTREAYIEPRTALNEYLDAVENLISEGHSDPFGVIGLDLIGAHRKDLERRIARLLR